MMRPLLAAALIAALAAGPAAADPLEGLWRTGPDDQGVTALVQVAPCGAALCGTLVAAADRAGRAIAPPNLGRLVLWGAVPQGRGAYAAHVHAPDRDQSYPMRLRLRGNRLSLTGCVLGRCRPAGTWRRAG